MIITAYTPHGAFFSAKTHIPPLDRQAAKNAFLKAISDGKQVTMETTDGYVVIPAAMVARSVFVVSTATAEPAQEA